MDTVLIVLQGLVVIGAIAAGARSGGIALGLWGGAGALVLIFVFGLDPGTPPVDAMLIIVAVISATAALQAAGGIDYLVLLAARLLRRNPGAINYLAPYSSYVLTIATGTGNTFYSLIPVINEVSYANGTRVERPLASSVVASTLGITSSPLAAATAAMLPLVEVYDYSLTDVLAITIPSSIVAIAVMSFLMSRRGKDLEEDEEFQARLAAGKVPPPVQIGDDEAELKPRAKLSLGIYGLAILVIVALGIFEDLRPLVTAENGLEPLGMTPIIQAVMLTAGVVIFVVSRIKPGEIVAAPVFSAGMVAMIALFGLAWMADTFISGNEETIVGALGAVTKYAPFLVAVAILAVAALTTSQSAATRTIVPIGLALQVGPQYMIAMWQSVVGVLVFPINGTQIAAAEQDPTGTTKLGTKVVDHSFQLPLMVAWITTSVVGLLIAFLLF